MGRKENGLDVGSLARSGSFGELPESQSETR